MDTGVKVRHPFDASWELPVYVANFVLMDYGTGAIFGCPAHDHDVFSDACDHELPDPAPRVFFDALLHDLCCVSLKMMVS